ncbi:hypothetical protein CDD83_1571 [Cordyceps sp. RAO-2017]|nr:hypothetical protein CDD83_1571 [Cordyceps sp. RAO-2017]
MAFSATRASSRLTCSTIFAATTRHVQTYPCSPFCRGRSSAVLTRDIKVASVEEDGVVQLPRHHVDEEDTTAKSKRDRGTTTTQFRAPWNLHAISHRTPLSDLRPGCFWTYHHNSRAGEGTYAYVIDTGVRVTHKQFEGRAVHGCTIKPGVQKCSDDPGDEADSNGHGTHVAGIIAAKTYGVAKKARVVAVKVFDDSGQAKRSETIRAFNWAVNSILENRRAGAAVINMSWSNKRESDALSAAIDRAFDKGVITVVCAGNQDVPASECSPACAERAITVGSMGRDWTADPYNYGPTVDILAPGRHIISLSHSNDGALRTLSGTSMAAPHVAGLVLTAMSVHGKRGNQIKPYLIETATKGQVTGPLRGSPNLVANNNNARQTSPDDTAHCF